MGRTVEDVMTKVVVVAREEQLGHAFDDIHPRPALAVHGGTFVPDAASGASRKG